MSTERDAGLQALQRGDANGAIPLLETACRLSPEDYDAVLYLGAAYGQAGRQMDAITTITKAVQLQPGNAQARYNLGIAMDQGGYRDQAIQAIQQAITLQPDYPKAKEALSRLQGTGGSSESGGLPGAPSPVPTSGTGNTQGGYPQYGAPTLQLAQPTEAPLYSQSGQPPPAYGTNQFSGNPSIQNANSSGIPQMGFGQVAETPGPAPLTGYGVPENTPQTSGSPYAQQGGSLTGYGQPPPSPYGAPSSPYGAAPSPYGTPPNPYGAPPSPYGAAPVQSGYRAPGGYNLERPVYSEIIPDSFNFVQAAKDWGRVLISPAKFFQSQVGKEGMKAPLALLLLYFIPYIIGTFLPMPVPTRPPALPENVYYYLIGGGKYVLLPFMLALMVLIPSLFAWLGHLIGRAFGNNASYSASFRAAVYSLAPLPLIGLIYALGVMAIGAPVAALSPLILAVEWTWVAILYCMGLYRVQQISVGAAIGVFVLSSLAFLIVFFGACIGIGIVAGIIIAAAAGAGH